MMIIPGLICVINVLKKQLLSCVRPNSDWNHQQEGASKFIESKNPVLTCDIGSWCFLLDDERKKN